MSAVGPVDAQSGHFVDSHEQETEEADTDDEDDQEAASDETYTVCHKPPGNPNNACTIEVGSESALHSHLDHGDSRWPCSEGE